ncbi:hypothetical protein MXEN_12046 [Mycobacterium xenopi RIVM700367]|uniref:Uncharacterized protein n=1 Tax=Mycobacterium botniense TaxID=84962 RepID=A0A7I9XTK2_9MYCO|nr:MULTISPECIES: hypothetical protein [Mycobacterium]EID12938.1 hypothetical protein MXEN_12046 [Mycobacterium xenopi RIVM700367]GFG72696.1 hypothetical protein MBOT_00610 [Mycobacterium botniense]GFG74698.1 hypothetical protein MBOT_20630 [Mycobacterium botniense]GFG74726.1 hypothetical protein MBOT_20910 [Mycobacterium botniense]
MTAPAISVGETVTEIALPPVAAVLVLNSSAGLGDRNAAPNVVVNAGAPAALEPQQIGIRLLPGQICRLPLIDSCNGQQLPLYAIADGPGAQLELRLIEGW